MAYLTDRALASGLTLSDLLHIVIPSDVSQNPDGSSYKATIQQVGDALSGSSFNTYVFSGNADVATSTLTFLNNSGGTFTVTNSAALFSDNDINVTGGTYNPSNGCVTFTTNSGTTFDVCGFLTGFTSPLSDVLLVGNETQGSDIIMTPGDVIRNQNLSGLGTSILNLNSSFGPSGTWEIESSNGSYLANSPWIYGQPSNGTQIAYQLDNYPGEAIGIGIYNNTSDLLNTGKEIVINNNKTSSASTGSSDRRAIFIGSKSSTINSGVVNSVVIGGSNIVANESNKVYVSSLNIDNILSGTSVINLGLDSSGNVVTGTTGLAFDIYVTGGTFDNNTDTITFTNTSGGTFDVTGITDTFVIAGTFNDTTNTLSLLRNDGNFVNITGVTDTFTGNTSGDCITDLFVSNIHSCSPLNINPLDEGNVYFGSTSGVTIDLTNNRVGINNDNPEYRLDISGTTGRFFTNIDSDTGQQIRLSAQTTSGITNISISSPNAGAILMGIRGVDQTLNPGFGKAGDSFIYSSLVNNGLNIISQAGSGTDDYIRFYAGQLATTGNTPDLYIQGSGSTRGYIGINNDNPEYRLDIQGTTGRLFYDGDTTRNTYRQSQILNSGPSTGITAISIFSEGSGNSLEMFSIGTGVTNSIQWRFAGEPGDVALYASSSANNLNIMNNVGSGTTDNIRFYVGGVGHITGQTPAIHIQGSGSTKGYVGIGTATPTEKLDVSGKTKTINFQMTSGATNGYVLTSDASGNASWQLPSVTGDTNIYNSDGTLTGDRILSGDSYSLSFNDLTTMNYTLAPGGGVDGYSINIDRTGMSGAIGSRLLRITETSTGNELFGIHRDGYVKISNAYNMPTTSGAIGDVLTQIGGNNVVWQTPFPQWSAITINVSSSDITTIINSGGTIPILPAPPSGYTYDWTGVVKYNYGTTPYNNSGGGVWVIRQGTDEMAYGFNLNAISNDLLWHVYPGAGSASVFTQNYDQGLSIGIVSGPISLGDGDIVVKLTYRLIQI